jgi:agmatine deiminase
MKIQHTQLFFADTIQLKLYTEWFESFVRVLKAVGIETNILPGTNDIWCRDYMPIQVGKDQFIQFSLTNDYYQKKNKHLRTDPDPICQVLGIIPFIPEYKRQPIYLDGGNVIIGYKKAIITNKVFKDNNIPKNNLTDILTKALQVEKIIFIPREPGEYTGHADGMVRWVDEKTVLANDYAKAGSDKKFINEFYGVLTRAGLDVRLVPYYPVYSRNYDQPANGCYINYLQVGQNIFLPTFENEPADNEAIKHFSQIFGSENIIPVPCSEIARLGGVLNCLSWEIEN